MTTVANAAPVSAGRGTATETTGTAGKPVDPDLQLARDPKAGAGRLMVLAGNRPDLRGVIVDNPGCSPELRAWVGRMGVVGSGRSGRSVVEADSIGGSSAGDSGGAGDFGDSVSMAPTGWEPSDIGLGDDPFGSVLGDPLMGSLLFDDGGRDGDAGDGTAGDAEGGRPTGRARGGQRSQGRRTARAHTAAARTASATAASRTASPRTSSPRTTSRAAAQQTPPSAPPGPPVARSGRYAQPGYQVPGPGRPAGPVAGGYGGPRRGPYVGGPQDIPWVPGGAQGYSGAQPTVPPAPPAASYGARGYGTQPSLRSGRRPAPSSGSDTSAIKVVGWVLIIIIIIFLIRILTG